MTTHHNFIDGAWTPSDSGEVFENRNPADRDEVIGLFQKSRASDAQRALDAARRAYASWRLVPAPRRAEILFRAAQLIADRKEELARDMTREMGKVLDETRGDVQEAIDMTFFMAGEGRRLYGQTAPSELRDKFAMSVRQPVGVCSVITPWNFPMAIPSWKIVPALVCGNTVVFKPATLTPLSAVNFVRIFEEAGVPAGVVNLVTGGGDEVGTVLTTAPEVSVVSFTGSTDVGRTVSRARRAELQESASRDGRQERHHRDGRCRPGARARRLPVGRLRHHGSALHGGQPRRRARKGLRFVRRAVRRPRPGAEGRQRPGSGDPDGTVGQSGPARDRGTVCRDRHRRRRPAGLRRPRAH